MLRDADQLLALAPVVFEPDDPPKPFRVLQAARDISRGADPAVLANQLRSTPRHLVSISEDPHPLARVFGCSLDPQDYKTPFTRTRSHIGQLLLGHLAERAFEEIYKELMGTHELTLVDIREARSETDFRLLNGERRPVFRINIKFHGTPFQNAEALVGLSSDDCFALATYKIFQALQKQEREVLPYIFVIVGVPGLTGEYAGSIIPEDLIHLAAFINASRKVSGKRDVEDRIVEFLARNPDPHVLPQIQDFARRIRAAEWRVLSARKADRLLRDLLFERVYAVRVRAFARNYRNAELDMHFSLSGDLTRLDDFLAMLRERGLHGLTAQLERGLI